MLHHFHFPTKISRLYPIFSLVLLLNSSVLLYAWQRDQIKLESYSTYADRETSLKNQVESLLSSQKSDQAQLDQQQQKVTEATNQLLTLQKDVTAKQSQLQQAQEQLKQQQGQLSQNTAELQKLRTRPPLFSFQNNSSLSDAATKQADIKSLVSESYEYIQRLYGAPYLLSSIVITFVDTLSIEGSAGEIVIENSSKGISINIRLKDFDKSSFQDINTVIHEIIHGFHGVAVFNSSAIEEGMTIAATEAVMSQMQKDGKIPNFEHLYLTIDDSLYSQWNSSLRVFADNDQFYADKNVAKIYQLVGTAWYRLYKQDPAIFSKINAAYYSKVQKGSAPDTAMALDAIRASIKSVNGQSIDTYLATNSAFNPR